MWKGFKILIFIGLLASNLVPSISFATHIVGGGITYKCIGLVGGNRVRYEIQVEIYQDCLNGSVIARQEDIPAKVGIFSNDGLFELQDQIDNRAGGRIDSVLVPPNFKNDCVNNPPQLCLKRLRFIKTYDLPINNSGYKVVYTRCCRNQTIININRPGDVGATYFCQVPAFGEGSCNNSAYFKNYPPQIICINNPLVYDHSAVDPDGDSLSYEFCDAYPGGTRNSSNPDPQATLPQPIRIRSANPPSFGYKPGFTPLQPMGGNPVVKIDPKTGLITGTPNQQGIYVVAVCVKEWRNGVVINTTTREFQFAVTNCSKAVFADIPILADEPNTFLIQCQGLTIDFINHSTGGFKYNWDFGVPGATSTEFEPSYTYPDTGTYVVKLIVNEGTTCPDSIDRYVKVYPSFWTRWEYEGLQCPSSEITFRDMSEATYKPITSWNWNFDDGNTSEEQNPKHRFLLGGDYNVRLISKSEKGCTDTLTQQVKIDKFKPFAGNDTVIVKGESINFNAQGGIIYEWTPATNLSASTTPNPIGRYPDTGVYKYNVYIKSVYDCEGYDDIEVLVVDKGSLFIPSAFTPNNDGRNDLLRPLSVGYRDFKFFRVFNRYGELVFETNEIGKGWDGTYNGKRADVGTYFWVLDAVDKDGIPIQKKGDATLIR